MFIFSSYKACLSFNFARLDMSIRSLKNSIKNEGSSDIANVTPLQDGNIISEEEDEEELIFWQPQSSLQKTIDSMGIFHNWEYDGHKFDKEEVKLSYEEFDKWLDEEVNKIAKDKVKLDDKIFE